MHNSGIGVPVGGLQHSGTITRIDGLQHCGTLSAPPVASADERQAPPSGARPPDYVSAHLARDSGGSKGAPRNHMTFAAATSRSSIKRDPAMSVVRVGTLCKHGIEIPGSLRSAGIVKPATGDAQVLVGRNLTPPA